MTDENATKPLSPTVIETTPDTPPTEGEPVPTLEERLTKVEGKVEVHESRLSKVEGVQTAMLSQQQIADMIKAAIDSSVTRVENLVNTIAEMVGENVFDSERINSIDAKLTTRAINAALSDKKLDAVIRFINTLAADDVTDPDSKKTSKSWFERMEQQISENEQRSLSAVVEVSQVRADHVESMHVLKDGITTVNTVSAELKPLALSVARAQSLIDIGLRLAKRPRLAFGLFVSAFAAFGGGAMLTPEIVRLIGHTIVNIFTQGAN